MPKDQNLNINISSDKLEFKYSDIAFISVNPFGFGFDFGQQMPQTGDVNIVSRISLSPQHAKVFSEMLSQNVKMYEEKFGSIVVNSEIKEEIKKTGSLGFKIKNNKENG